MFLSNKIRLVFIFCLVASHNACVLPQNDGRQESDAGKSDVPDWDAAARPDSAPMGDATYHEDVSLSDADRADASSIPTVTIAELRAMPDGPIDVLLDGVFVTYFWHNSYYIQAERSGPAIFFYSSLFDDPASPGLAVGNMISLRVTSINTTFDGNRFIASASLASNDYGSHDVDSLFSQDLSAGSGISLSWQLESELVSLSGANTVSGCGPWEISYGEDLVLSDLYSEYFEIDMCVGATIQIIRAVVRKQYGVYSIWSHDSNDIAVQDISNCQSQILINLPVVLPEQGGEVGLWLDTEFHGSESVTVTSSQDVTFDTLLFLGEHYHISAIPEPPLTDCEVLGEDYHYVSSGRAGCGDGVCEVQCY